MIAAITSLQALLGGDTEQALSNAVWEVNMQDFASATYSNALNSSFIAWEKHSDKKISPGAKKRVGLKIYTGAGAGLCTPPALVKACIQVLINRGFERKQIILFDYKSHTLRAAGYLPPLSQKNEAPTFQGAPVVALDTGNYFDAVWHYESALPPPTPPNSAMSQLLGRSGELLAEDEDRYSLLPVPLLQSFDFWINLPMVMDDPRIGVSGALSNLSLWNISNSQRFWLNKASGAVAIAEIAAIPEMHENLYFSIWTLERYQFIGGPYFNALYTHSESKMYLSSNPTALDSIAYTRINQLRSSHGFPQIEPRPLLFSFAKSIGLGEWDLSKISKHRLTENDE